MTRERMAREADGCGEREGPKMRDVACETEPPIEKCERAEAGNCAERGKPTTHGLRDEHESRGDGQPQHALRGEGCDDHLTFATREADESLLSPGRAWP